MSAGTRHDEDDIDAEVRRLKEQLIELQQEKGFEQARAKNEVQQVTVEKEARASVAREPRHGADGPFSSLDSFKGTGPDSYLGSTLA